MGVPSAIDYVVGSELGGEVVLGEDNNMEEGEDEHLGDLCPIVGV